MHVNEDEKSICVALRVIKEFIDSTERSKESKVESLENHVEELYI